MGYNFESNVSNQGSARAGFWDSKPGKIYKIKPGIWPLTRISEFRTRNNTSLSVVTVICKHFITRVTDVIFQTLSVGRAVSVPGLFGHLRGIYGTGRTGGRRRVALLLLVLGGGWYDLADFFLPPAFSAFKNVPRRIPRPACPFGLLNGWIFRRPETFFNYIQSTFTTSLPFYPLFCPDQLDQRQTKIKCILILA